MPSFGVNKVAVTTSKYGAVGGLDGLGVSGSEVLPQQLAVGCVLAHRVATLRVGRWGALRADIYGAAVRRRAEVIDVVHLFERAVGV